MAVNIEMSNNLKRQLAEQIKKNKAKFANMDKKKAEEILKAKSMRAKAMQERAQAKDVLEKASYEAHSAQQKNKQANRKELMAVAECVCVQVIAEAAGLKKQSQDEAAAMLAEARKQVEEEKKKAEEIAEQSVNECQRHIFQQDITLDMLQAKVAAEMKKQTEEHNAELVEKVEQSTEEVTGYNTANA